MLGSLDASGKPVKTSTGVQIAAGVKATLIMRDINLVTQNYGFYCMAGSEVDLWIEGENNTITGGANTASHSSAIEVPTGSKLTISSMAGDYTTAGKLTLTGTTHGAGIGGSCLGTATCGEITILGGTIIAQGGLYAAGIGAGSAAGSTAGNCGTIAIYGGDVTAIGGSGGAGIGGATDYSNTGTTTGNIIIGSGAKVTATGGGAGTSESIYESDPIYDNDGNTIGHNIHATMLIRSAIPGKDGELYFSGDENLLNALGLNTIQKSSESRFTASVYDAHSGAKINTMTAEGSEFKSIIPPEIDI